MFSVPKDCRRALSLIRQRTYHGSVKQKGEYKVKLTAKNDLAAAEREFRIVVGDKIALTPHWAGTAGTAGAPM